MVKLSFAEYKKNYQGARIYETCQILKMNQVDTENTLLEGYNGYLKECGFAGQPMTYDVWANQPKQKEFFARLFMTEDHSTRHYKMQQQYKLYKENF